MIYTTLLNTLNNPMRLLTLLSPFKRKGELNIIHYVNGEGIKVNLVYQTGVYHQHSTYFLFKHKNGNSEVILSDTLRLNSATKPSISMSFSHSPLEANFMAADY